MGKESIERTCGKIQCCCFESFACSFSLRCSS